MPEASCPPSSNAFTVHPMPAPTSKTEQSWGSSGSSCRKMRWPFFHARITRRGDGAASPWYCRRY